MEAIQITQTNANDFKSEILKGVKIQIDELKSQFQPKEPNEYLTRQEVAKMFNVDISTVHNWCKSKKLNPLGSGARVYFLRSEIEASLTPLNV